MSISQESVLIILSKFWLGASSFKDSHRNSPIDSIVSQGPLLGLKRSITKPSIYSAYKPKSFLLRQILKKKNKGSSILNISIIMNISDEGIFGTVRGLVIVRDLQPTKFKSIQDNSNDKQAKNLLCISKRRTELQLNTVT